MAPRVGGGDTDGTVEHAPLKLERRDIRGQIVLIATEDVVLEDLRLADPSHDRLVIQCQGELLVSGHVEALVVARRDLVLRPGCTIAGGLVVCRVPPAALPPGEVAPDPWRYEPTFGGRDGREFLHASFSPRPEFRSLEGGR